MDCSEAMDYRGHLMKLYGHSTYQSISYDSYDRLPSLRNKLLFDHQSGSPPCRPKSGTTEVQRDRTEGVLAGWLARFKWRFVFARFQHINFP